MMGRYLIVLWLALTLVSCAGMTLPNGTVIAPAGNQSSSVPSATPTWTEEYFAAMHNLEVQATAMEQTIAGSPFASSYQGQYQVEDQLFFLVTGEAEAVEALLVAEGYSAAQFTVRTVALKHATLQAAVEATLDWIGAQPISGGAGVDVMNNEVDIFVDRAPMIALLGFDPGDERVPYEQWPPSLKEALAAWVPENVPPTSVDLRLGFWVDRLIPPTTSVPLIITATPEPTATPYP